MSGRKKLTPVIVMMYFSILVPFTVQAETRNNHVDNLCFLHGSKHSDHGHKLSFLNVLAVKQKKKEHIPVSKTLLQEVLIERLIDPISKAIEEHYEPRLWYRGLEEIVAIKKDEIDHVYYVTVQVQTFEGAHNPPYGEETITFQISGNEINVFDYMHRDLPEGEWSR